MTVIENIKSIISEAPSSAITLGKTFTTECGPKGQTGGKPMIIASARGRFHGATFLGVTDIRFLRAEGVDVSPEQKEKANREAKCMWRVL